MTEGGGVQKYLVIALLFDQYSTGEGKEGEEKVGEGGRAARYILCVRAHVLY